MPKHLLVFTDLDGTLLDEDDYSHRGAAEALERLRRLQIPLIFVSSKTRAEIEALQARLNLREPFIVENGAAVYFPEAYRHFKVDPGLREPPYTVFRLGVSYAEIRRFFVAARERFRLKGFGDMSLHEIGALTGLPPEQAALAGQREFTEPFVTTAPESLDDFTRLAADQGFRITHGGRFHHLMGALQDKGRAVRRCAAVFARNLDGAILTAGLGDSANDVPLLENVDIPVLMPRRSSNTLDVKLPGLVRAKQPGSTGWNAVVLDLLSELKSEV